MRWLGSGSVCLVLGLTLGLGCGRSTRPKQSSGFSTGGVGAAAGGASDGAGTGAAGGKASAGTGAGASSATGGTDGAGTSGAGGRVGGGSGRAGSSSGAGAGVAGNDAGSPSALPSCVLHAGLIVDPPMGASLGGIDLAQKFEEGCEWRLGVPVEVPTDDAHPRLVMHYDVNGDQVDDLFFGPEANHAPISSLKLLVSKPYSRDILFEDAGCEIPLELAYESIFTRDLDGDTIPDWVVATPTGVKLLLYKQDGLHEVGGYDFDETVVSAAVTDVAVVRFEATSQVAVGYDLFQDDDVVTGVVLFEPTGTGDDLAYEGKVLRSSALSASGSDLKESGYVTTVLHGGTPALFGLGWGVPGMLGWFWDGADLSNAATAATDDSVVNFAAPVFTGNSVALAVGFPSSVGIFGLSDDLTLLESVDTFFTIDGLGREPGGGTRRTSRLLRDLDRDGNDDLIELGSAATGAEESFVISLQRSGGWERSEAVSLHGSLGAARTEDPFLHLANVTARIVIRDAGEIDGGPRSPALQSLKCELP